MDIQKGTCRRDVVQWCDVVQSQLPLEVRTSLSWASQGSNCELEAACVRRGAYIPRQVLVGPSIKSGPVSECCCFLVKDITKLDRRLAVCN